MIVVTPIKLFFNLDKKVTSITLSLQVYLKFSLLKLSTSKFLLYWNFEMEIYHFGLQAGFNFTFFKTERYNYLILTRIRTRIHPLEIVSEILQLMKQNKCTIPRKRKTLKKTLHQNMASCYNVVRTCILNDFKRLQEININFSSNI